MGRRYPTVFALTDSCARPGCSVDLRSRSAPRSAQVAASPCCKQALPDIISAILVQALGPLPGGDVSVLQLVASQDTAASHHKGHVRLTRQSLQQLPQGGLFPGCSHSLMFRLPDSLDLQVAPAASFEGRPGRLHHASLGWLPAPRCGIATCVNEQFTRLDFHQLDCSLVGCSPSFLPSPHTAVRSIFRGIAESLV